ncbi:MAG: hypothetical protein ACRDT0_09970 [Pseudonocardiaceae bacterium]
MNAVRELVGEVQGELTEHGRIVLALVALVLALVLAGGIASVLGSDVAVAVIAGLGMLGTAVTVLVYTARRHS